MTVQSRHSALIVSITRSAWALAFGARMGVTISRAPSERTTSSNDRLNFVSRSSDEEPDGAGPSVEVQREVPGLLGDPGRVGLRGRCAQVDPPAPELDEHQDIERPEPGGLDGEEVAGDPVRLGPEELGPGWAGAPRGRPRSRRPEQGPDRRRCHGDPELAKLAFNPHATPAGLSRARRRMSSRIAASIGGRQGRPVLR